MKIFIRLFIPVFFISIYACETTHRTTHHSQKSIEEKYALVLDVKKEDILNKKLYYFIDEWHGTSYQYGGKTKKGVDCSGLTILLYKEVFEKEITGSSSGMYNQCQHISKVELEEGDLVFFKIESKEVSHVGVYLQNNKFVHATTKAGVKINDLNEEYYKKYFIGAGKK